MLSLGLGPSWIAGATGAIPGVTYDQYWAQTVLLLGFNGTNGSTAITDESPSAHTATVGGDAQISNTKQLFSQNAGKFDGTGDYISFADSADWSLGNGDFTIETFFNGSNLSDRPLFSIYDGSSGAGSSWLLRHLNDNTIQFVCYDLTGNPITTAAQAVTSGNWYYYCVDRSGATLRIYFGPAGGSAAVVATQNVGTSSLHDATSALVLAAYAAAGGYATGYLKEVRVTKGVARYANGSGFTVPATSFPRGGLPFFSVNPTISGNSWVGQTLTLSAGTDNGTSRSYQWKRDGVAIAGETGTTYVNQSADIGHSMTCAVTATNTNGATVATSNALAITATDPLAAIRGSRLAYVNNTSSVALTLPTGSVAGDLMVIFAGHGFGVNTPSGWTVRDASAGSNYNGGTFSKVLSAGDISTGSVTVSFTGSYYGTVVGVTFVGGTSGYRDIGVLRSSTGAASRTVTTGSSVQAGDYLLVFGSARVNAAATSASLSSALQNNTALESSSVARFGIAGSSGAQSATINYAGSPTGDYQVLIAIAP